MKIISQTVLFFLALVGCAKADLQVTHEKFASIFETGEFPEAVLPDDDVSKQHLRKLSEPRAVGDSCGRNAPCQEGLECVRAGFSRQCAPVSCVSNAMNAFIERNGLQDLPNRIREATGYPASNTMNATAVEGGWAAFVDGASTMLDNDFRQSVTDQMIANKPDLEGLLYSVLEACPEAATRQGITLLIGLNYELGLAAKYYQNFMFAVGTGDLNIDVGSSGNSSIPSFDFNITAGIFSDCCGGAGIDVGFDFSLTFGLFQSGVSRDLLNPSWMCDLDAGVGSLTGFSYSDVNGVPKFLFSQGVGLGLSLFSFACCRTIKLADVSP